MITTELNLSSLNETEQLPTSVDECHSLIQQMRSILLEQTDELKRQGIDIETLKLRLHASLRDKYGRSTEKVSPDQLLLFAESLLQKATDANEPNEPDAEPAAESPKKHTGGGRKPLPKHLAEETENYYPDTSVCTCGATMTEFAVSITEQLDFVPSNFKRIRHVVHKHSCKRCKKVVEGKKPEQIHSGGIPTAGVFAQLSTAKYGDHLPLYRQNEIYERQGVELSLSTMGRWMQMSASALRPVYARMIELMLLAPVIMADETPLDFIDKTRVKKKIKQGYLWTYFANDYVIYDFNPDRCAKNAQTFLTGYQGFLLTDGYGGYDWFPNHRSANCNVHCRRYFEKALKSDKKASFVLSIYQKLYEIESRLTELSPEEIVQIRQRESVPLLKQMYDWMIEKRTSERPKSLLGIAINYALNRWDKLCRYTQHGFLKMDTNLVENAIRPIAVSRKNWLFLGNEESGEAASIHASLVNTCKRLGVNPFEYLRDVLERLGRNPNCNIDELLPDRWQPAPPLEA